MAIKNKISFNAVYCWTAMCFGANVLEHLGGPRTGGFLSPDRDPGYWGFLALMLQVFWSCICLQTWVDGRDKKLTSEERRAIYYPTDGLLAAFPCGELLQIVAMGALIAIIAIGSCTTIRWTEAAMLVYPAAMLYIHLSMTGFITRLFRTNVSP